MGKKTARVQSHASSCSSGCPSTTLHCNSYTTPPSLPPNTAQKPQSLRNTTYHFAISTESSSELTARPSTTVNNNHGRLYWRNRQGHSQAACRHRFARQSERSRRWNSGPRGRFLPEHRSAMGAMDGTGRCYCRPPGHWERGGAECASTTTADAAHAAAHAHAEADASCSDAYAHATAPARWVCASSYANAYAPRPSTRTNAYAEASECFYVTCSTASE